MPERGKPQRQRSFSHPPTRPTPARSVAHSHPLLAHPCPTCGRCNIDLFSISEKVEEALLGRKTPVKIAIMGCVVNGPGEAREADIGIAGGDGIGILFEKGKVVKKFPEEQLVEVLLAAINAFEKK